MSRTVRRKSVNISFKKGYLFDISDVAVNGLVDCRWCPSFNGLSLKEANAKKINWFHSCKGPSERYCPGKGYRQKYRAKSKHQLIRQLKVLEDYEAVQIDKVCSDHEFWS